jgi:hypothetical protein
MFLHRVPWYFSDDMRKLLSLRPVGFKPMGKEDIPRKSMNILE